MRLALTILLSSTIWSTSYALTTEAGQPYTDAGATAWDALDGDITSRIVTTSNVNTARLGTYSVTYSVTNSIGLTASATRSVIVADRTPPVITLRGANPQTVNRSIWGYADPGATAMDSFDGNLTVRITVSGTVNTWKVGVYNRIYKVADSSMNVATKTRSVVVK